MARKLLSYFMVVLAFILTAAFYLWFDLEGILWSSQEQTEISASQIKKAKGKDYTGKKAGAGIKEVKTIKDWNKLTAKSGYVTVTPEDIKKTGVYSLAKWKSYYTDKKNRKQGEKKTEAISPVLDYTADYTPFYIITLKDGNRILAQMNRGIARKIARGKEVKLPLGRKAGLMEQAKKLLKKQCKKEKVSIKSVLYTIDNAWEAKNEDAVFWGRIGITIFIFIFIAILLQVIERALAKAWFKTDRKSELQEKVDKLSDDEERFYKEADDEEEGELS